MDAFSGITFYIDGYGQAKFLLTMLAVIWYGIHRGMKEDK